MSEHQDQPPAKAAQANRAYPAQVVIVCGKCGTELRISHPDLVASASIWVSEFLERHLHQHVELVDKWDMGSPLTVPGETFSAPTPQDPPAAGPPL